MTTTLAARRDHWWHAWAARLYAPLARTEESHG